MCCLLLMLQSLAVAPSLLFLPEPHLSSLSLHSAQVISGTFSGSALPALSSDLASVASHPSLAAFHLAFGPTAPHLYYLVSPQDILPQPPLPFPLKKKNQWLFGSNQDLSEDKGEGNLLNSLQNIPRRAVPGIILKCKCEGSDFILSIDIQI